MSLHHVPPSCPSIMSLHHVHPSCPSIMSLHHVPPSRPSIMSLHHVPPSPSCMSLACPLSTGCSCTRHVSCGATRADAPGSGVIAAGAALRQSESDTDIQVLRTGPYAADTGGACRLDARAGSILQDPESLRSVELQLVAGRLLVRHTQKGSKEGSV